MTLDAEKRRVRAALRARLDALPPDELRRRSDRACAHALAHPAFVRATTVLAYAPLPGELDVTPLLEACLDQGRRLCLPRADWDERSMVPVPVRSLELDVEVRRYGVREPRESLEPCPLGEVDVIVVPGLGFDRAGNRIGRGAGFYDRLLGRPDRRARACGVAFTFQLLPRLPFGPEDAPVDAVVTDEGTVELDRPGTDPTDTLGAGPQARNTEGTA